MPNKNTKLSIFGIAMLSVAGVFSIRSLPSMAEYGFTLVTYYIIAAIVYFIPSALICAELGTGWPKTGGLYVWVREAHGPKLGFLAIWLEWVNTVVSFPTMLSFGVATLAYITFPSLAHNKFEMLDVMLVFLWGITLLNLLGIRTSLLFSSLSTLFGMVLPAALILIFGIAWVLIGKHSQISFSAVHLIPNLHWSNSAFLAGLVLAYAGMQIAGFHAQDVQNPQKNFPRGFLLAAIIILVLSIFGALSVAIVIPQKQISLVAGIMQVIQTFFTTFHLAWLVPLVAVLILIGFFANLNTWVLGPSRGLQACAKYGSLPKLLAYTNKRGTPVNILLLQAIIGTVISMVFLFMPNVSSSYWLLTVLSAQLTFIMDILLFSSVVRLRYTQPDLKRGYRIPGGEKTVWAVAGIAIAVCVFGFIIGFFPPSQIETGSHRFYDGFLIFGILLLAVPALFIHK